MSFKIFTLLGVLSIFGLSTGCHSIQDSPLLAKNWIIADPSLRKVGFTGRRIIYPEELKNHRNEPSILLSWTDEIQYENLSQLEEAYKNRSREFKSADDQAEFRLQNLKDKLKEEDSELTFQLKIKDIDSRLRALKVPDSIKDPGMVLDLVSVPNHRFFGLHKVYCLNFDGTINFDKPVGEFLAGKLFNQDSASEKGEEIPFDSKFPCSVEGRLKQFSDQKFNEIFKEHLSDCTEPKLHCLYTQLEWFDSVRRKEHLSKVIQAADEVIKVSKADPDHHELYIDALYRKGRALAYMELPDVISKHPIEDPAAHERLFQSTYDELSSLVDMESKKYFLLHIRYLRRKGLYGLALDVLQKHIDAGDVPYLYYKKRRDLYGLCGWGHRWMREGERLLHMFPKVPGRLGEEMPLK